jgi:iron complex outermembrane recepter protein
VLPAWPQTPQSSQSNESLKQLSLEELGNIEVTTASKEPVEVWQTPAAIYVITQDDIQRSGARSIPEVLRLAPGVEVERIDSSKWSVGIRGFGSRLSRSVLVLIDGRTVYTTLFAGTYWEVQNVMIEDIDRIEVIRGPGGTIWGPNAVDGVINIITKSSKDTQGTLVSAGGGNEEQGFFDARYGGSNASKNLDYRAYGMGFNRGPEYHPDGRNFDGWRDVQGGFRMDWAKTNRDAYTFQGDIYDESEGEQTNPTMYTPPFSVIVDNAARLSGGNIMGRWKRVLGDGNDVQLQAYYDRTNRYEANLEDLRDAFDVDYLQRHRLPGRQQLSWGLGARIIRTDDPEVVSGLTFVPSKRTDQLYTAFVQDDIGLIANRLTLTVGSKVLRTNYTDLAFEPTARLLWTPTSTQSFWVAFTHAVRTPSDSEEDFNLLGLVSAAGAVPYLARFNANPDFAPEQLNGSEIGYRRLIGKKVYVDIASFYNHYHDLFSEDITGLPFIETSPPPTHLLLPAQFRNDLLGDTKGVEVAPEWQATSFWRLRGSYSFLHMSLETAPNSFDVGTPPIIEGSSPQHQVDVQSYLDLSKALSLDIEYRHESSLPAESVPAYSTADVHFAWQATPHVRFSIVGDNLLQPFHAEANGDPTGLVFIKRSGYGEITWTK